MSTSRSDGSSGPHEEHAAELSYGYFEHDADVGIVGRGGTLEAALVAAARASFALMIDPELVLPEQAVTVTFDEPDPEFALVCWINGLLAEARVNGLALAHFDLQRSGDHWIGHGAGSSWSCHPERGVEVKGATLTMLSVREQHDGWEARCVVDV